MGVKTLSLWSLESVRDSYLYVSNVHAPTAAAIYELKDCIMYLRHIDN